MTERVSPQQEVETAAAPVRYGRALAFATIAAAALGSTGCASRAAPFDNLDQAQVTILRLQAQQAAPHPNPAAPPVLAIPGLPPELQQLPQQLLAQAQAGGLLPPGFQIPGLTGPAQPAAPQLPLFRNQYPIAGQRPVMDADLKDDLLDLFGSEDSFNDQRGNCFFPGMAISFQSPQQPEPVDVVISLSCNQAVGYGFQWPHPSSGLTAETRDMLTQLYQNNFGPVPPGA